MATQLGNGDGRAGSHVVVMAASAGGLAALQAILRALPADFACPILIVQHLDPRRQSLLAPILGRCTALPVHQARDGDAIPARGILIAPPNRHLIANVDGTISVTEGAAVHYLRPSADPLFESAAAAYKGGAIGVVLSGTGSDASTGVRAIRQGGGVNLAEDPATAEYSGMPQSAIRTGCVDFILPLSEVAGKLVSLTEAEAGDDSTGKPARG